MSKTLPLQQLIRRAHQKKKHLGEFLKELARKKPIHLLKEVKQIEAQVWKEVDCLESSNCCRTGPPTFKKSKVKKMWKACEA